MRLPAIVMAAFLGGIAGSAARSLVMVAFTAGGGSGLAARMAINVFGAFLAGLYLARREADPGRLTSLEPLLVAGFLGGFTTVAGYALDGATAIGDGAWSTFVGLVAVDGAIGLAAAALGHRLARRRPAPAH